MLPHTPSRCVSYDILVDSCRVDLVCARPYAYVASIHVTSLPNNLRVTPHSSRSSHTIMNFKNLISRSAKDYLFLSKGEMRLLKLAVAS